MKFLVLSNQSMYSESYKGIVRNEHPILNKDLSLDKKESANKIFAYLNDQILDLNKDDGQYYSSFDFAYLLALAYNEISLEQEEYKVYEITYPFEEPSFKKELLGFEVLYGNCSCIMEFFDPSSENNNEEKNHIKRRYAKYINENLLFQDLDSALNFYCEARDSKLIFDNLKIIGIYA